MIMQAIVIDVQWNRLLVQDLETRQRVIVHTPDARWFIAGDLVLIWYDGVMTKSIPPQITALRIATLPPETVPPARPPVFFPPIIRPPFIRPPFGRPGAGRPPQNRPGPRPPRSRR